MWMWPGYGSGMGAMGFWMAVSWIVGLAILMMCVWFVARAAAGPSALIEERPEQSFRDAEDLLAQRGITVSYETIRWWCLTFGPGLYQRPGGDRCARSRRAFGSWDCASENLAENRARSLPRQHVAGPVRREP
jgi:hypothetical protein